MGVFILPLMAFSILSARPSLSCSRKQKLGFQLTLHRLSPLSPSLRAGDLGGSAYA